MKKTLGIFLIMLMGASCRMIEEEALYNEYDDDWNLVLALAAKECQENSRIFGILEQRNSFSTYFDSDDYYKVTFKSGANTSVDYIRLSAVTGTDLKVLYYDTSGPTLYEADFTATQNQQVVNAIKNGACSADEDLKFTSVSGLDSSSAISFTNRRKDDDDDVYTDIRDAYTAKTSFPLALMAFNTKRTTIEKLSGDDPQDAVVSEATLADVDCSADTTCNGINWSGGSVTMTFTVNEAAYSVTDPDDASGELINVSPDPL